MLTQCFSSSSSRGRGRLLTDKKEKTWEKTNELASINLVQPGFIFQQINLNQINLLYRGLMQIHNQFYYRPQAFDTYHLCTQFNQLFLIFTLWDVEEHSVVYKVRHANRERWKCFWRLHILSSQLPFISIITSIRTWRTCLRFSVHNTEGQTGIFTPQTA